MSKETIRNQCNKKKTMEICLKKKSLSINFLFKVQWTKTKTKIKTETETQKQNHYSKLNERTFSSSYFLGFFFWIFGRFHLQFYQFPSLCVYSWCVKRKTFCFCKLKPKPDAKQKNKLNVLLVKLVIYIYEKTAK